MHCEVGEREMGDTHVWERMRRRHDRIAVIGALLVPPAIGAVLTPVRTSVPNTDAALVLVAFVVAIAAFGNRAAGYLATFGAVVWFGRCQVQ
jgi:hypothetical protein